MSFARVSKKSFGNSKLLESLWLQFAAYFDCEQKVMSFKVGESLPNDAARFVQEILGPNFAWLNVLLMKNPDLSKVDW